jgi:hypothetical protein
MLICGNFDGASVNFGNKSGVFKRLSDEVPQAIGIHCIAQKLELAVMQIKLFPTCLHLKPH